MFAVPQWANSFYSKFPLVALEPEDSLDWKHGVPEGKGKECTLWVHPRVSGILHDDKYAWASSLPTSLHAQLLFLLRGVPVNMRFWSNEGSVPGQTLPTLHLTTANRLVPRDDIRSWLDSAHELSRDAKYHGMPHQAAYDEAVALAKLVLGRVKPALLVSMTDPAREGIAISLSEPPALLAGLTTPLPASLTGDARDLDESAVIERGVDSLTVVAQKVDGGQWALGAEHPSPLDALVASHVYCIYCLPLGSPLRQALDSLPQLNAYVTRVMDFAASNA